MRVRQAGTAVVAAVLLVAGAAGCARTVSGTGSPAVAASADFPSVSASPTDTDPPTDEPTGTDGPTDEPTDEPTDTDPPAEDGSVQQLCNDMADTISGPDLGTDFYVSFIRLDIIGWGIANSDADPFSSVDGATTAACPDVRTAVLAKTATPDLASLRI